MPKGPNGEKRPGDTVQAAIQVARIATGEEEEELPDRRKRDNGKAGGAGRAATLSQERRHEIAKQGASARWT